MALFDLEVDDADLLYRNLRDGAHSIEVQIRNALDSLWRVYEPYADDEFPGEFARDPEGRFWEMYLTTQLLEQGKNVRPRSDLASSSRSLGPDIRIEEDNRTIWIEAIAPTVGAPGTLDQVPDLIPINRGGGAQAVPRRQVELRISSAVSTKRDVFQRYLDRGLIADQDICLIAISGSRFFAQSSTTGLPPVVSAVYPLGDQYVIFDRDAGEIVDYGHHSSESIHRTNATPIPRYAFLNERFAGISGLIWSRQTIGNVATQRSGLTFLPNVSAPRALPRAWTSWQTEYVVDSVGENYELRLIEQSANSDR